MEMLYDSGLASRSDNPLGGAIFDVMFGDVEAYGLPMPTEAVA